MCKIIGSIISSVFPVYTYDKDASPIEATVQTNGASEMGTNLTQSRMYILTLHWITKYCGADMNDLHKVLKDRCFHDAPLVNSHDPCSTG